jgi:DNA polymerase-1
MREVEVNLPEPEWLTSKDTEALQQLAGEVRAAEYVAIDTETTGLRIAKDQPIYWSLGLDHRRVAMPINTITYFMESINDTHKKWVMANAKFDMHMLANYGTPIQGIPIDVAVMHALIFDSDNHGLKDMSKSILKLSWGDFTGTFEPKEIYDPSIVVTRKGKTVGHMADDGLTHYAGGYRKETIGEMLRRYEKEDVHALMQYASFDAYATLHLFYALDAILNNWHTYSLYPHEYKTMNDIYTKTEVPFTRVLWKCERNGVRIDKDYLRSKELPIEERLKEITKEAVHITKRIGFNIFGRRDMEWYCFQLRKLKPLGYTGGGRSGVKAPKMDGDFFEYYAVEDDICRLRLEAKKLQQTKSTFIKGILEGLDYNDRIHTRYNQNAARTGRLSSSDPNLQNIPNPENDVFALRKAFIARKGYKLICADYNALEMRLLAAAAMEKDMINIFLEGKDIHIGNAANMFELPYDDIVVAKATAKEKLTPRQKELLKARSRVKAISFGLNYGMKARLLALMMECSIDEAMQIMERYLARYPAVSKYYQQAIDETRDGNTAYTIIGRQRYLPSINSFANFRRWQAERQSTNLPIQGGAADVVRLAMNLLDTADIEGRFGARMLMQVHDELIFECPEDTCEAALAEITGWMEHPLHGELAVPLTIAAHIVDNWGDAK